MRINVKAVVKAVIILVFLTVLPLVGRSFIPQELIKASTLQGGFDLLDFLNRIAVIGIVFAMLVLVKGHIAKTSLAGLALSVISKVFWLVIVFFFLGLGHPETFGLFVIGGKSEQAENTVVFDFRLFAVLSIVVVALMIARSVLQFQESRREATAKESESRTEVVSKDQASQSV